MKRALNNAPKVYIKLFGKSFIVSRVIDASKVSHKVFFTLVDETRVLGLLLSSFILYLTLKDIE
jgi:hypothetical protein